MSEWPPAAVKHIMTLDPCQKYGDESRVKCGIC